MLPKQTILALLAATASAANTAGYGADWCNVEAPVNIHEIHEQVEATRAADKHGLGLRADETFDIDVYFHVVAKSKAVKDGYVPKSKIVEVMDILNDGYSPTPFRFTLKSTNYVVNTKWEPDSKLQNDYEMKKTLRQGSYRALNVYIMKDRSGGYAALPTNVTRGDHDFIEDGIVIGPDALNGNDHPIYNQGKTLTHETGHWLGLLHTFEGYRCHGDGDFVDDTPFELSRDFDVEPIRGPCSSTLDSCPDQPGLDPINNYMDYSDDKCKTEFTQGQITRMIDHYKTFRQTWA